MQPDYLTPIECLIFHGAIKRPNHIPAPRPHDSGTLITRHKIHNTPNGPIIGSGVALTQSGQRELAAVLSQETKSHAELLPWNLLAHGKHGMLWYVPAARRPMYFRLNRDRVLDVRWPTLVFQVSLSDSGQRTLSVAATVQSGRPHAKTRLYHAPLMNIYRNGVVCTGSAELPDDAAMASMAGWEDAIYRTWFTHVNHDQTLRSDESVSNGQLFSYWASKAKTADRVRAGELTPLATLGEWLSL